MSARTRLALEQLEDRQVPSVFITPGRIPLESIRHCHSASAQGPGNAGGVITVHVTANDALRNASPLTETVSLLDQNGQVVGTAQALTGVRVGSGKHGPLLLKFRRCALKAALQNELASAGKTLRDLTSNTTVQLTLTDGAGSTPETASLTIVVHHRAGGGLSQA
jgi:hypothetical protein